MRKKLKTIYAKVIKHLFKKVIFKYTAKLGCAADGDGYQIVLYEKIDTPGTWDICVLRPWNSKLEILPAYHRLIVKLFYGFNKIPLVPRTKTYIWFNERANRIESIESDIYETSFKIGGF